ncbi:MAG: leucine-rich repeat domain-containing protein [Oscillospiraceae bacterium]
MKSKKIMAGVSAAVMLLSVAVSAVPSGIGGIFDKAITASALITSGDYQYDVLDNGTVEISKYSGSEWNLTIPNTIDGKRVTSIGNSAFAYNGDLGNITIPDGVESIGDRAFAGCINLTSIIIPDNVTNIGSFAFLGCYKLTSITIPYGVTSIGNSAFADCTHLTSITIPSSVTSIQDSTFRDCYDLTSVKIPSSVTSIGESAFRCFYSSSDLTSITIPSSVTSIGSCAFYNCSGLTIYCCVGSNAETYASANSINYSNASDISLHTATLFTTSYVYDGAAKTPSVSIPGLTEGTDYTVTYYLNTNAGTAVVTVWGEGNYIGSITKTFEITKLDMTSGVSASGVNKPYDGSAASISVTAPDGATVTYSTDGINYTATNPSYIDAGEYTIYYKVTKPNYNNVTGSAQIIITKLDMTADVTSEGVSRTYDGNPASISVTAPTGATITYSTDGTNYTATNPSYTDVGNYTVYYKVIKANYADIESTETVVIAQASISNLVPSFSQEYYTYDGKAKKPTVTIDGLTAGKDFTVTYSNNINVGMETVTINGIGNYYNNITRYFYISPATIYWKTFNLSNTSYVYDGTAKTPTVTIAGLTEGTDFTVTYSDNTNAGTATATITGIGNYSDSRSTDFTISPASISGLTPTLSQTVYTYDGTAKTPTVTIAGLTEGTDFTVAYSDNTNVGTAGVTIYGLGNYTGEKLTSFTITPATLTGVSASGVDKTYDGVFASISVTAPDGATVTYSTDGTNYTATNPSYTDVGNYKVYYKVTKANYDDVTGSATVKIINSSIAGFSISGIKTNYDGSEHGLTYTVPTGATISFSMGGEAVSSDVLKFTDVGTYTIDYVVSMTNYDSITGSVTVEIDKAAITASVGDVSVVFDKNGATPTADITLPDGATIAYSLDGTTFSGDIPSFTSAGSYTVYYEINAGDNYDVLSGSFTVTVQAKDISGLTAAIDSDSFVYTGDAIAPVVTIDGLTEGTDFTVTYSSNTEVGTAQITVTGIGNYTGTLTKEFAIIAADTSSNDSSDTDSSSDADSSSSSDTSSNSDATPSVSTGLSAGGLLALIALSGAVGLFAVKRKNRKKA